MQHPNDGEQHQFFDRARKAAGTVRGPETIMSSEEPFEGPDMTRHLLLLIDHGGAKGTTVSASGIRAHDITRLRRAVSWFLFPTRREETIRARSTRRTGRERAEPHGDGIDLGGGIEAIQRGAVD